MQPLNAIDALGPAFTRTHEVLFKPFRWGQSWKLSASQYLGWCGSMFLPLPLFVLLAPPGAGIRGPMFVVLSAITVVGLVILYFCGRMELVAFEMVVTRARYIAPMWRRYGSRIWPWLGWKIVIGTVFTAVIAALFVSPMKHMFVDLINSAPDMINAQKGQQDPAAMMQAMMQIYARMIGIYAALIGLLFLLKIPSTLLNDFVLPFYVLEGMSLTGAINRGLSVFMADPVQVLLYLILKPILFVIGYIMQTAALQVAMIPVVIVVMIVVVIAGASFHHATGAVLVLLVAGAVVLGLVLYVAMMYAATLAVGYLLTLLEAYGIYFLAGRYPLLGNLMEPGPGGPFTPPPVFPSREERGDDDGGPPMPMDPAVA